MRQSGTKVLLELLDGIVRMVWVYLDSEVEIEWESVEVWKSPVPFKRK